MRRFAVLVVVGGMLLVPGQALAAKKTGPLKKVCQTAFVGEDQQSQACAILWYDASTKQLSTRCTVEYSFSGVSTDIFACELNQGRKKTYERTVAIFPGGPEDTSTTNHLYTFETPSASAPKVQWSAFFDFQPSLLGGTGPEVQIQTPWVA